MNIWCFSSFPSNNRLSENFFDGITKPKPTPLSGWRTSATTGCECTSSGRFRISHPFHPLVGNEYEVVGRHLTWGEDRVLYYGTEGRLKSFLVNVTDLFPNDAFT